MKREVFFCDHCDSKLDGSKISFTALEAERHLCIDCASDFELWIKPFMAKISGYSKVEIVKTEKA